MGLSSGISMMKTIVRAKSMAFILETSPNGCRLGRSDGDFLRFDTAYFSSRSVN